MAVLALHSFVVRASELLKYQPNVSVGDYETLDIKQRPPSSAYAETFEGTISRRYAENPNVVVLETPITCRLFPAKKHLNNVVKAINDGKRPAHTKIEAAFLEDGQHRWTEVSTFLARGIDVKIIVNFIVCDDDEATEVYININGKARKPAPSVTDLFLANKLRNGKSDPKFFERSCASLMTWHLTKMQEKKPLPVGLIELPLSRPPVKHELKFHRTVGLLQPMMSFSADRCSEQVLIGMARRFHSSWEALGLVLRPTILNEDEPFLGNLAKDWAIPHVFNIFTAGMIVPLMKDGLIGDDLLADCQRMQPIVKEFLHWLETNPTHTSASVGFRGLGGQSSESPYVEKLRALTEGITP